MGEGTKVGQVWGGGVPHVQWEVRAEALGGLSGVGRWLGNKNSNLLGTQLFLGGHKEEGVASLWN